MHTHKSSFSKQSLLYDLLMDFLICGSSLSALLCIIIFSRKKFSVFEVSGILFGIFTAGVIIFPIILALNHQLFKLCKKDELDNMKSDTVLIPYYQNITDTFTLPLTLALLSAIVALATLCMQNQNIIDCASCSSVFNGLIPVIIITTLWFICSITKYAHKKHRNVDTIHTNHHESVEGCTFCVKTNKSDVQDVSENDHNSVTDSHDDLSYRDYKCETITQDIHSKSSVCDKL